PLIPRPKNQLIVIGMLDDVIDPFYQKQYCRANGLKCMEVGWGHRVDDVDKLKQITVSWFTQHCTK
ncbi:hypothetical protein, partial [Amphritea sp.]|uniref:hypothetical protein n=1 Tax=Amphritea sp. TaxID=1872502 RepID=UPI003566EBD0